MVAHKDKTLSKFQKHIPESKTHPKIWILGSVLDSGKCFGFWEVFLDSGTCFGLWDVFWILGRVFGFLEVFWNLGSVLSLRATVAFFFFPTMKVFTCFLVINTFKR